MLQTTMTRETRWLLEEKYRGVETPEFRADVARLEAGEPLAYVIGWVDFLRCRINLSLHPLIPRPETEFWVERAIAEIQKKDGDKELRILDLFSGSGCIGIALAKHLPNAKMDFGEIDPKLCEQIKKNIELNNIDTNRVQIIRTDVFSDITESYDSIFANPPYIDPAKKATVQSSVREHEPHSALFADEHGLAFIKQLLIKASDHLNPVGTMFIEFGENQKEEIATLAKNVSWKHEFWNDQYGRARCVVLQKVS